MKKDRRQRIHMLVCDRFDPEGTRDLPIKPGGAEVRVIHVIVERFRRDRLRMDLLQHIVFCEIVCRSELFRDAIRKEFFGRGEFPAVDLLKMLLRLFAEPRDGIDIMIGDIKASCASFPAGDFVVAHDLLKRQLKRIADVVEKRSNITLILSGSRHFLLQQFLIVQKLSGI